MGKMVNPEDPMTVLRNPHRDGDEKAKAMRRLKEPLRANGSQQDQDEAIDILGRAATADPSPKVEVAPRSLSLNRVSRLLPANSRRFVSRSDRPALKS